MNSENFTKIDRQVQVQSNFKSTLISLTCVLHIYIVAVLRDPCPMSLHMSVAAWFAIKELYLYMEYIDLDFCNL